MSSDHSCHAGCQKPLCMLRREKDLREENAQLRATNARMAGVLEQFCYCERLHSDTDDPCVAHSSWASLDDLRVIREAMDAIDCGCTDDNCWRREAYAALKERFGDNK